MTVEDLLAPVVLGAAALLVLAALAVLLVARRDRARAAVAVAEARAESDDLRQRLDTLVRRLDAPARPVEEFVITQVGTAARTPAETGPAARIEGRLFADIVLRESVVKAASLGHGVRRALAPETRNRIRFEMKREVKRSRRQRRAELKDVRRSQQARQRRREVA